MSAGKGSNHSGLFFHHALRFEIFSPATRHVHHFTSAFNIFFVQGIIKISRSLYKNWNTIFPTLSRVFPFRSCLKRLLKISLDKNSYSDCWNPDYMLCTDYTRHAFSKSCFSFSSFHPQDFACNLHDWKCV